MAKVAFSKLGAKLDTSIVELEIPGIENKIEVLQYLPIDKKLNLIARVMEFAHDGDNNFSNPLKVKVYFNIAIIEEYTNIAFTDKQKEDIPKLYDILMSSGWINKIINSIPENEIEELDNGLWKTIKSYYKYRNSVLGIMDTVAQDYTDLEVDAETLNQQLANKDNLGLLRSVISKLG